MIRNIVTRLENTGYEQVIRKFGPAVAVGICLWSLYSVIAPGVDYRFCYTWMVNEPERLKTVADFAWTLNPPWLAVFMAPFVSLPDPVGFMVFLAFTIAAFIYGANHFRGKIVPMLLSAQFFWILWWGQIEAFALLGLILAQFAFEKKSWKLMFLALIFASFKPQVGFIPVLAYWWWSGRERWKPMLGLLMVFALSLLIWGPWPVWYAEGLLKFAGDGHANGWNASIGLIALPLFVPALLVPLDREKRILALTATALLVSPYMPYYSSIILLVMNIPIWAFFFAFTGYLTSVVGTTLGWNIVAGLPVSLLIWIYWPYLKAWTLRLRLKPAKMGN
jgi:hypothetical protein